MSIQSNLTEQRFEDLMQKLQDMDSELSISPVTPKEEKKEKWKRPSEPIELDCNDITSSSVETEKATYEVKNIPKPLVVKPKLSEKKKPVEKVFAYNKYLGAMQFMSPEERMKTLE